MRLNDVHKLQLAQKYPSTLSLAAQNSFSGMEHFLSPQQSVQHVDPKRQEYEKIQEYNKYQMIFKQRQREHERNLSQQEDIMIERKVKEDKQIIIEKLKKEYENPKMHNRMTYESVDIDHPQPISIVEERVEDPKNRLVILPKDFHSNLAKRINNTIQNEFAKIHNAMTENQDNLNNQMDSINGSLIKYKTDHGVLLDKISDLEQKLEKEKEIGEMKFREIQFNVYNTLPKKHPDYKYKPFDYFDTKQMITDNQDQYKRDMKNILNFDDEYFNQLNISTDQYKRRQKFKWQVEPPKIDDEPLIRQDGLGIQKLNNNGQYKYENQEYHSQIYNDVLDRFNKRKEKTQWLKEELLKQNDDQFLNGSRYQGISSLVFEKPNSSQTKQYQIQTPQIHTKSEQLPAKFQIELDNFVFDDDYYQKRYNI